MGRRMRGAIRVNSSLILIRSFVLSRVAMHIPFLVEDASQPEIFVTPLIAVEILKEKGNLYRTLTSLHD